MPRIFGAFCDGSWQVHFFIWRDWPDWASLANLGGLISQVHFFFAKCTFIFKKVYLSKPPKMDGLG